MASQTQGIQQLLTAEKKAADKINEARKKKARRLKQAKEEAQAEIEKYRQERERQFKEYEATHLGNKGEIAAKIEQDTEKQLKDMNQRVAQHKDVVITKLLELINQIEPEMHKNASFRDSLQQG